MDTPSLQIKKISISKTTIKSLPKRFTGHEGIILNKWSKSTVPVTKSLTIKIVSAEEVASSWPISVVGGPYFLHVLHVPLGVSCVLWESFLISQKESPDHIHMELVICACAREGWATAHTFSLSGQMVYERIYQKKKSVPHTLTT